MPGIMLPSTDWVDLYAAASIPVGTKLLVQNQGSNYLLLQEVTSAPDIADTTGRMVVRPAEVEIDAGSTGAWMRCFGGISIFVQRR